MYNVLVSIALQSVILRYVLENERKNCECALSWHHRFIKYFAPIVIVMLFVNLLFSKQLMNLRNQRNNPVVKLTMLLLSIFGFLSFVYSITLIVYFFRLHIKDCKCSEDWKRFALIAPIVVIGIIILVLLFLRLLFKFM
jgi:hypothetical protein